MLGEVKWYNIRQGFGFVVGEDGEDVFLHKGEIPFWTIYLNKGDKIEYTKKITKNGIQATKLKLL